MSQPPWDPNGQQGQQPYPGGQYGPSGALPPPGWYLDPGGQQVLRWWDGTAWGQHTQPLPGPSQEPQRPDPGVREDTVPPPDPLQPQGWPQQPYGQGPQGPQPPPPGLQHGQGPRKPWSGRRIAAVSVAAVGALLIVIVVIAGVTQGSGTGSAAGGPSAAPSASALAAPPSPSPSSTAICTSHACIVSDIEQSLVGQAAKDGSVITKAVCHKSTVRANPGDTYTASCDVTYSDGEVWSEYATLLAATDQITWEPEQELQ